MHVASLTICQSDLRQQIVGHAAEDELYEQVKDKLQQHRLEKRDEDINWKKRDFLLIKAEFIFQT